MLTDMERKEYADMVSRPGRFEGEQAFTPYFWDIVLNGAEDANHHDVDGTSYSAIHIDAEIVGDWPDLAGEQGKTAVLWETDQGFVYCEILSAERYAEFVRAIEEDAEDDGDAELD